MLNVEKPTTRASILTLIAKTNNTRICSFGSFSLFDKPSLIINIPTIKIIMPPTKDGTLNIYLLNKSPAIPPKNTKKNWKKENSIITKKAIFFVIFLSNPRDKATPKASNPRAIDMAPKLNKDKKITPVNIDYMIIILVGKGDY